MQSQLIAASAFDSLRQTYGEMPIDISIAAIAIAGGLLAGHVANKLLRTHLKGTSIGAISLLTNIVRAVIALLVVFFLGENVFSVQMSGMVQALGVTTLVVSLGLQDLIKSVVAGMLIVASDIVPGVDLPLVKTDIEALAARVLTQHGWIASDYMPQVMFMGSSAFGTRASIRIFISDIEYAVRSMDAVMCAISERGYLADCTHEVNAGWKKSGSGK